jgi:hypothetical protein
MELIIFFAMLVAIDSASLRWGFNSNDGFDNPEWERRQRWSGFH